LPFGFSVGLSFGTKRSVAKQVARHFLAVYIRVFILRKMTGA
jgi:hypothetical protein